MPRCEYKIQDLFPSAKPILKRSMELGGPVRGRMVLKDALFPFGSDGGPCFFVLQEEIDFFFAFGQGRIRCDLPVDFE